MPVLDVVFVDLARGGVVEFLLGAIVLSPVVQVVQAGADSVSRFGAGSRGMVDQAAEGWIGPPFPRWNQAAGKLPLRLPRIPCSTNKVRVGRSRYSRMVSSPPRGRSNQRIGVHAQPYSLRLP